LKKLIQICVLIISTVNCFTGNYRVLQKVHWFNKQGSAVCYWWFVYGRFNISRGDLAFRYIWNWILYYLSRL